jgi:hypothetical protein
VTSFLRVNGINLPVAEGSASVSQEEIGADQQAVDGTPIVNRRRVIRKWSGRTNILTAAEALAFRDLITGKGHTLNGTGSAVSVDQLGIYTSKGLAPSAAGGAFWSRVNAGKFALIDPPAGAGLFFIGIGWTVGYSATYPMFTATAPWTVSWWQDVGTIGVWHHHILTSTGLKWLDGVSSVAAVDVSGSSGAITLGSGATGSVVSDFQAWPFVIPNSWAPQMFGFAGTTTGAGGNAMGMLPRLNIDGLFVEQNSIINVRGTIADGKPRTGYLSPVNGGAVTLQANLHDFGFTFTEV